MKVPKLVSVSVISLMLVACCVAVVRVTTWSNSTPNSDPYERPHERQARLSQEAKLEFQRACTNLLGWQRTIESSCWTYDAGITNWYGTATIDFVNAVGGVERKTAYFLFRPTTRSVYCHEASQELWLETLRRISGRAK